MKAVLDYVDGHKTYIVAGLIGIHAVVQALGYPIPDWVYTLEAAAGLGAVRSAIGKVGA
jgi:hypothetical protein